MMKKVVFLILLVVMTPRSAYLVVDKALTERVQVNVSDAMFFTIAAKVVNDYIVRNPEQLPLKTSAIFGIGAWLGGEALEAIYKEVYKSCTGLSLREGLGSTDLLGIEIDFQRLLRRALTFVPLYVALRLRYELAKDKAMTPSTIAGLTEQIELGPVAV